MTAQATSSGHGQPVPAGSGTARRAVDPAFWRGRRVFLTGHTGFKGSWLTCWLSEMGAQVTGFSLPPATDPSMFDTLSLRDRLAVHHLGDIRDADALRRAIAAAEPDVVIHMAAQPIISVGYEDPVGTFATNAMGTVHLLDACRSLPAETVILVVSSDKCYLERGGDHAPYREDDPLGGYDPYSASKAATEVVAHAYLKSFFSGDRTPRMASGRAGNVVGGGDWAVNRLVPDMARAFARGEPVVVRNPKATRPWQHVIEPLSGYLVLLQALAEDAAFAGGWNFGPAVRSLPVAEVVRHAVAAWGGDASAAMSSATQEWREAPVLELDCSRAAERLGWQGILDIETTIGMTMDWYKSFSRAGSATAMMDLTLRQIDDYARRAQP